jgi:hypothetical protein
VAQNKQANIHFFYGKMNENYALGTGFTVQEKIITAVKRIEFVSDRMPAIHNTMRQKIQETWRQRTADTIFLTDCFCNCR